MPTFKIVATLGILALGGGSFFQTTSLAQSSSSNSSSSPSLSQRVKSEIDLNAISDKPFVKDTSKDLRKEFTNPYNPENPNPDLSPQPTKEKRKFDKTISKVCVEVYQYEGLLEESEIDAKLVGIPDSMAEIKKDTREKLIKNLKKYKEDLVKNKCKNRPFDAVFDKKEPDIITNTEKNDLKNILDFFLNFGQLSAKAETNPLKFWHQPTYQKVDVVNGVPTYKFGFQASSHNGISARWCIFLFTGDTNWRWVTPVGSECQYPLNGIPENVAITASVYSADNAGNVSYYLDKQSYSHTDNRNNGNREFLYYSTLSKNLDDGFFVDGMYANRRAVANSNTYGNARMTKIPGTNSALNRGEDIWIVTHGYSDNSGGSFWEIGNDIKAQFPDATVLTLDWSNIAYGGDLKTNERIDLCRTANWIRPLAERVVEKLKRYGITDPKKVNLVGHSLGTLVSGEISRIMTENSGQYVSRMILLDPPSETLCNALGVFGIYNTKSFPFSLARIDRFANFAERAVSFAGNRSVAANQGFNLTADYSYWMEFDQEVIDYGQSHAWVVQAWRKMNSNDKLRTCLKFF
jgi:pimeloyl-ACP methyl ester carboxylesterase